MLNRRHFLAAIASAPLVVHLPRSWAAGPAASANADDIIRQSLKVLYYGGDDLVAQVTMSLINANGKSRKRNLSMLRKNIGARGDQRYFIYFHSPPDVADVTFLVHKYPNKDDDRWMFLPAVRMVKRVAASDKRSSFVGSDFSYDDVSGRDIQDETNRLIRAEDLGGRPCHVIESTPKDRSSFAKRLSWIDRERFVPLKEEFISQKGEKTRAFSADEVKQVSGIWTISKRTMRDVRSGHRTEVEFRDVRYNVGLSEDIFSETSLRSPPRQWLK